MPCDQQKRPFPSASNLRLLDGPDRQGQTRLPTNFLSFFYHKLIRSPALSWWNRGDRPEYGYVDIFVSVGNGKEDKTLVLLDTGAGDGINIISQTYLEELSERYDFHPPQERVNDVAITYAGVLALDRCVKLKFQIVGHGRLGKARKRLKQSTEQFYVVHSDTAQSDLILGRYYLEGNMSARRCLGWIEKHPGKKQEGSGK